jgi:hypothetical protein
MMGEAATDKRDAEEGDFALPGVVVVALRRGVEMREVLGLDFAMVGDV